MGMLGKMRRAVRPEWWWTVGWMRLAGLGRAGRFAARMAALAAPPYKGRRYLANMNPKGYVAPWAEIDRRSLERGQHVFIGDRVVIYRTADGAGMVRVGDRASIHRGTIIELGDGGRPEVGEESFWAETYDLTLSENPVKVVELPLADLSRKDRDVLQPGSAFYWLAGYEDRRGGQRRRSGDIRLKRGPTWTGAKLERGREGARRLFEEMVVDSRLRGNDGACGDERNNRSPNLRKRVLRQPPVRHRGKQVRICKDTPWRG